MNVLSDNGPIYVTCDVYILHHMTYMYIVKGTVVRVFVCVCVVV